jgi:hypothetical protein
MFTQAVIEQIGYYVYLLKDPRDGKAFYVGKGVRNRLFDHLSCALASPTESEKLGKIREIMAAGHTVEHFVVRHGMSEEAAFEVEAAMIDLLGAETLSNIQGGRHSANFGMQRAEQIKAMYDAEALDPKGIPIVLINLNKLYRRTMTAEDLYEATRKSWVIGERRNKARFAVATFRGLTREVYTIEKWFAVPEVGPNRWAFTGTLAPDAIRQQLRYKSIAGYFRQGAANPVKYLCC